MQQTLSQLPELLLAWYDRGHRALPWRQDREAYHVWLSEIMLQQTRVEAVKGYYTRFLAALPDIPALAACGEERLKKLWEGLGYYSRMRNLQKAAQTIVRDYAGVFPQRYEQIRALPGVGDYTAGAICSICFELPVPAVDGNVLRVMSRVTEDEAPVTKQAVKKAWAQRLQKLYPAGRRGDFTQALMELGAVVCVPNGAPKCAQCPLASLCAARAHDSWRRFPVKEARRARREEEKTVFLLHTPDGRIALRKRADSGLLAGLWELPNVPERLDAPQALAQLERWGLEPQELQKHVERQHIFTHVVWRMRCFSVTVARSVQDFVWADAQALRSELALPSAFRMFLP